MRALVTETDAATVFWNRQYEKDTIARDTELKSWLKNNNRQGEGHVGNLFFDPWQIMNKKSGSHFKVFFAILESLFGSRLAGNLSAPPARIAGPEKSPENVSPVAEKHSAPNMETLWQPGERGAHKMLDVFFDEGLEGYAGNRDIPGGVDDRACRRIALG